jgi:PEP-CTERM/exosortase A-associated glycosyltransferase
MSRRVLHVLDHSIPLHSGYTFRTCEILREQQRLGWETIHLTSPKHTAPGDAEEDVDGLHFHRTPWSPGRIGRLPVLREISQMHATARRLGELVRRTNPDILHAHSPVLDALPALWVGWRHRIPVVYEVRAFWEDAAVDHGTSREGGLRYRATRALETFALRRADHVTTICEGLKRDIVARGIPETRITVIPNAVNATAFAFGTEPDQALKQALGLEGCTILGFIGSYYAYEGLDLLLAALPRIARQVPQVRVLLVGGGPQEDALKETARTLGVLQHVVFAGRVPHRDVQRYYSIVDVFVYPRHSMRLTELVTPLKPLEAMAQGRLVVASDVGGHRELIRNGENGVLFRAGDAGSLADAIIDLLAAKERWQGIRDRGRQFVERERTWAASVSRYRPVFDLLAPNPR